MPPAEKHILEIDSAELAFGERRILSEMCIRDSGNLTVDHRRGDFRIDLSGGDIFMSQHLRKRLQTHAVRQADRRGVRVPCHVERELFVDAALSGDVFQTVVDRIECRHGKNTSVAGDVYKRQP